MKGDRNEEMEDSLGGMLPAVKVERECNGGVGEAALVKWEEAAYRLGEVEGVEPCQDGRVPRMDGGVGGWSGRRQL